MAKYQWIIDSVLDLPGVTVVYKPEWDAQTFLVTDKLFAMQGQNKEKEDILTVKGKPEDNFAIKMVYKDITSGYYANKEHWISIKLESKEIDNKLIIDLLKASYQLVFNALPKKKQLAILEK